MERTPAKHVGFGSLYPLPKSKNEDPTFEKEQLAEIRNYYRRLEALIVDCLRNGEFRLAWKIIGVEERMTHSSRMHAEQAGLACIGGLGVALDRIGFAVKQNRSKTAWRIHFFVTH
jgi:hypothetical protein